MWIRDAGVWKEVQQAWVRDAGVWKEIKEGWIRDAGVWKKFLDAVVAASLALTARTVSDITIGENALAGVRFNAGGSLQTRRSAGYTTISGQWATASVDGNLYELYVTASGDSGISSSTGTFGTWLSLDLAREFTITRSTAGTALRTLACTIREKANTGNSVSANISLEAVREDY